MNKLSIYNISVCRTYQIILYGHHENISYKIHAIHDFFHVKITDIAII